MGFLCWAVAVGRRPDVVLQRLGTECYVVYRVDAPLRWPVEGGTDRISTRPGDAFLISVEPKPQETLSVGVYLYASKVKVPGGRVEVDGPEQAVSVSALGRQYGYGYESRTLHALGVLAHVLNPASAADMRTVQLFLPYASMGLPFGEYRFRYRVRVVQGDAVVDDFFLTWASDRRVKDGGLSVISARTFGEEPDIIPNKSGYAGAKPRPRIEP